MKRITGKTTGEEHRSCRTSEFIKNKRKAEHQCQEEMFDQIKQSSQNALNALV